MLNVSALLYKCYIQKNAKMSLIIKTESKLLFKFIREHFFNSNFRIIPRIDLQPFQNARIEKVVHDVRGTL